MNLSAAMEMVDDDLPDGAFWAMVHELAGAEYGDAWDEVNEPPEHYESAPHAATTQKTSGNVPVKCYICGRTFKRRAHRKAHAKDVHPNMLCEAGDPNYKPKKENTP